MTHSQQRVRDGNRIYTFPGWQVAYSSSERPGVPRWSELTLYKTVSGEFYLQKVGRTTVAHREDCRFVNHRMPAWLDAHEEAKVRRTACAECQPLVGDRMDPHTRLEPQRYSVYRSDTLLGIYVLLQEGRSNLPPVVSRLISLASTWEAGAPN